MRCCCVVLCCLVDVNDMVNNNSADDLQAFTFGLVAILSDCLSRQSTHYACNNLNANTAMQAKDKTELANNYIYIMMYVYMNETNELMNELLVSARAHANTRSVILQVTNHPTSPPFPEP